MTRRSWLDWTLLGVLVVVWGSSFAMTKIGVASIAPSWLVAIRLSVAAAVLVPVVWWRGERLPRDWPSWLSLAALAVIGNIAPFWLVAWGTAHIASSLSGILMATVPLAVIVMAHFLLPDEPLSRLKGAGFVVGFAGVVLLLGPQNLLNIAAQGIRFWAQIAVLAATLCYAAHSMIARLMPKTSSTVMAAAVCALGAVMAVPLAFFTAPSGLETASTASLAAGIALGLFPTALASLVVYVLLARAGASFVSTSNYLIPAFAVILGALALSEKISVSAILGLAFILAGIAISEGRWRKRQS